jgi:hypothetical protein
MDPTETKPEELAIPPGPRPPARSGDGSSGRLAERPAARGAVVDGMGNGRPGDPDEMRLEIERTRQRMSATLDTLEDRLVRQKREIWAKATLQGVRRRIGTEPWRSLALAFVVGYVVAAIRD